MYSACGSGQASCVGLLACNQGIAQTESCVHMLMPRFTHKALSSMGDVGWVCHRSSNTQWSDHQHLPICFYYNYCKFQAQGTHS